MTIFIIIVGGLWGLLTLLGQFFDTKKCITCKYYGLKEYMNIDSNGQYRHLGCS